MKSTMNSKSLRIIGKPRLVPTPSNKTGPPLGATGSETDLTSPEELIRMKALSAQLITLKALSSKDGNRLNSILTQVMTPATLIWTKERVATLLSHYYVNGPEKLQEAVLSDWLAVLLKTPAPPAWALQEACLAWLQRNDNRKPSPGQIRALTNEALYWTYGIRARLTQKEPDRDPENCVPKERLAELSDRLRIGLGKKQNRTVFKTPQNRDNDRDPQCDRAGRHNYL